MSKHTPGPWKLQVRENHTSDVYVDDECAIGDRHLIAMVITEWMNKNATAEDLANARLIAAAPELLNAAKLAHLQIVKLAERSFAESVDTEEWIAKNDAVNLLKAAIAKAEGK